MPHDLKKKNVEELTNDFLTLVQLKRDELQREIDNSFPLQYSLLKYLVNHPEKLDIVPNEEIFDRDPRSIFLKLKKYEESLKVTKNELYSVHLLKTYFDPLDTFNFETEVETAEEPDGEYNARKVCETLQALHNDVTRFKTAFSILHAKDTTTAAIYANQLARITDELPVHATVFSTDTRLKRTKYTLKHCGVPILEDSNFYILMGKEKSGKSHILSVFLSAYLFGSLESFKLESMIGNNERVLYIDTEQSASDAHNICQTANLLAGRRYDAPNENLTIASCDEVPPAQMLSEIETLIEQYKPKVVFIDGYAGLLEDAYMTKGADPLMREIRYIARRHNLVILGVFHVKSEDNPLAPEKAPNVSAFGAFGKVCQRYGGGTFYVDTQECYLTKVVQIQARKSKCPTFYCKFDGVIYIDVPGRDMPDMCPVIDGNTDEILQPRHLDINDDCVHSFFVPHYLTEGEYLEKADIADIQEEKKAEERKAQKAQLKMESDKDKFREELAIIFKDDAETLSKEEINARWFEYARIQEDEDKLDKKTKDRWKKRLKRCLDSSLKLEILRQYPSGLYGLINLPSQK